MEEEISLAERFGHHEVKRQEELVQRYFGNIEEKIRAVRSKQEALEVSKKVMRNFESECLSEVLPDFLKHYLAELVEKYWGKVH